MRIAVLGCGPAGLMAAEGATEAALEYEGGEIAIFSRKRKSELFGAQYLHQPIPYASPPTSIAVDYRVVGEAAAYKRKVYGNAWYGSVSPEDLLGSHEGWDIRETYDNIWRAFEEAIHDVELDAIGLQELLDSGNFDVVINSVPLETLCYQNHDFAYAGIIAAGDAPERGIDIGKVYRCPESTVICNGTKDVAWYRMSRVFGHTTVEWPADVERVPINSASFVRKPTHHNCDCWPTITKVGRYGSWSKGVLSHTAYFDASEAVHRFAKGRG
jgi:hypothetical protein